MASSPNPAKAGETTDDGWVIYRPGSMNVPPDDYTPGDEWTFRGHEKSGWVSPVEDGKPEWYPQLQYRYRPSKQQSSGLPDDNPKTAQGALKTPLLSVVPATALLQMGEVMALGKAKYGSYNWRDYPVSYSTYVDAAMRHLMQYWDGETTDPESGQSHLAHAAAGLAVLMDAIATGNATDDRPKPGAAGELIALFKKRREEATG